MNAAKNSADYQRAFRQRLKDQGLVQKTVYILPEHSAALRAIERQFQKHGPIQNNPLMEGKTMSPINQWTTETLLAALAKSDLVLSGAAEVRGVEGATLAIDVTLVDYGDLGIQICVAGGQIFVSSPMWARDQVIDVAQMDEMALRLGPVNPLSNMGIMRIADRDWYVMFGELSSYSLIEHVIEEIETLAENTVQAAEAFQDQLKKA